DAREHRDRDQPNLENIRIVDDPNQSPIEDAQISKKKNRRAHNGSKQANSREAREVSGDEGQRPRCMRCLRFRTRRRSFAHDAPPANACRPFAVPRPRAISIARPPATTRSAVTVACPDMPPQRLETHKLLLYKGL